MAHIPMAYDAPGAGRNGVVGTGGSALAADGAYSTIAAHEGVEQSLLLPEHEQAWAAEMAAEGAGHLPISWYRQTPRQALLSTYGVANTIVNGLLNLGINAGLGYAVLKGKDVVGLWQEPNHGEHPYKSAAFSDLLITTVLITFLTSVISTPGIRTAMKKGQVVPVDGNLLHGGCLSCSPVRMLGTCTRSLLLALWALLVLCVPFIIILSIVCSTGRMTGSGSQCSMPQHDYIWLKAVYSMVVAMSIYPFVMLSAVNTRTAPPLDLSLFLDNQKQRWEDEKKKENPL